jgi:hypothetical protein
MYELDGIEYTLEELEQAAVEQEMAFDEYISSLKSQGLVEKQEATEETANFVAEDEAALESMNTDLTSETVLSDYDSEVQKINLSYDEEIENLDVTEADKKDYSEFVVDESVVDTKTKQLNEQRLKDLALAEQKRNDRQLLADSKNPETSSGRGIHDWLDNESTTETFKSNDYGATVDALKTMYPDYSFEIETRGDILGFGGYDAGIKMTAPNGDTQLIGPKAITLDDVGKKDRTTAMKSDIIKFVDTHGYDAKLYDEADKKISEETKRINSIVNVTDAEAAEIEEESQRIDLFKPYTEDVAIYGGGPTAMGDFMVQQTKQVTVNPYEKELDAAEKMLNDARAVANKKRSIDNQLPAATEDEIKDAARKIIYNNKYNQLQDDKWTDYLEANDDEMQGILKAYKAVEEDKSFKLAAGWQKLQEVELADYNSSASEGDRVIIEDFEKIYLDNSKQFIIEEGQETIQLRNGKTVPKEVFDKYLTSSKNLRDKYARLQDRQSRIDAETDKLKSIDAQFDLLRRDYDTWSKFQYNVGSGFASIGAGLAYGVGKVVQGGTYFMEDYDGPRTKSEAVGDFLDETATKFTDWKNMSRDQYAKDVSFDRAFTSGPAAFGRFMTQEMGQQLPILATIIASGGTASPYVIGAYAAGEKYMEMDQEDLRSGFERNELVKFGVSAGYGAAEAVFESLTTVQILKRGKSYLKAAGGESLLNFNQAIKQTWKEQGKRILIQDPLSEAVGEGLTQMTQNMLDGVGLLDNVDHAMFSGGMFGFGMSVSPVMYGMALQKFSDPKKYDEYNNAIKDISSINKLLKNDLISESSREILRKKKADLETKSQDILKGVVSEMENNMGKDGWKRFNRATQEQEALKKQAQDIYNDPGLSKDKKQELLNDLKEKFDATQYSRDLFRNNKAFKNTFKLLEQTDPDKYNSIMADAKEKIRIKKNENPDFTPEIKEVQDVAYDIYTEQVILDKVAAAQNSYGVSVNVANTNAEAIELVKNAENLSEEDKSAQIKSIKDGTLNGLDNINGQQFVILENSVKNDRTSIGVHEPGHAVFEKILGTKDGDFRALESAITEYLSKTDPDMLNVIKLKMSSGTTQNIQSEEFVIEFLEQVDQGNIDFKQKKNRKLASLFGFMTNGITKEKGFEVNFKGETDAVSFLIGLAKKISSGTLTEQDVADARSSEALAPTVLAAINSVVSKGPKKKKVKTSKEQDDRNVKYRDIFNKRFRTMTREDYLNYMLVNGVPLNKGGELTPEGAQLFEDISRDWIGQVMQLSSFDAELAMTTITGPFLNHLLAMNPETQLTAKNPIAAYMGNYAPFKVGDARKQMAKGASPSNSLEIDAQVEGRKQFDPVAAEEVNIPEELNFTRQSGVLPGSDMYNAILRANELVLGTKLPKLEYTRKKKGQPDVVVNLKEVRAILKNKDSISRQEFQQAELDYTRIIKDFRNNIAAQYESILYDNIKESLGKGTAGYDQRLLDLKNAMVEKLSVSDLVAMERLSKDKIFTRLDRTNLNVNEIPAYEGTGRLVYSNPKSGPNLYSRLNPIDQAFVDFFKKRGRDEALIKNLAKTYGFDGTMQVMTQQDTIDKITNRNPELNYLVADDVIQVMASAIDRGVQSKLSKEVERQFSEIKNPTANNFGIYMEDKDRLIKLLLDTGYNVGFSNDIKKTKGQVRSIVESLYGDKLSKPEVTKIVDLYTPLINKFGKQVSEYKGITDFPLKSYIDGSLNADENATLNKFWNLKNIGALNTPEGRQRQKAFINVSIPQLVAEYAKQGKSKLDLAADFILFKGGFEDGGLKRNMTYGNEFGSGGHVEVFNKELIENNFDIVDYKFKTDKSGATTLEFKMKDGSTREVLSPKRYAQKTTMDMVTNSMSPQDIAGRNEYSDRAWNFITTYYKTVNKMLNADKPTATIENAAMLMKGFNDNMKGPMRAAGRLTYVPINIDTKGYNSKNVGKLFEYEHGIPSSVMNLMIADAIFNKNKDISLSKLKDSYQVGVIAKGFDDNFGNFFKASMPLTYQYGDSPLTRWFNEFTIGGEVTELFNIQTGKIVKESVGPAKLWNSIQQAKASNEQDLSNNVVKMSMETNEDIINYAATVDAALNNARKLNAPVKKIRIFDFDDTLARSNSKVFAIKNGERIEMSAEEFASNGAQMLVDGYNFDFTDFNIVRDGKPGPLLDIAKKIQAARGTEDVFVLTARASESQGPIKEFLDSVGLNIPLSNITGLGNSTGAAKAKWVVEKAAEGYNDFYFADDAYQNVKAVRDAMQVIDVKSKVQQAKMSLESDINEDFNKIIEEATGIRSEAKYSEAKGKIVGAKKGRFKFFIPYSAEDFLGLIYPILPKGAKGDSAMKWFKERLMDPYTRAANNLSTFRKNMFEDFKKLKEDLDVPKDLKKTNESGFSNEQAVRVYIWTKQGMSVPGLSKGDTKELLDIIEANQNLKTFADEIMKLNKTFEYNAPSEGWLAGTITTDLIDGVNKNVRRKYLEEWQANVDIIFSQENLNKLEAAYGTKYVEALKNVLERMKQGKNRLATGNRLSNRILDYINNANGVVMFLNIRSAVLQTLSSANFINWSFNNPYQAGKAFANQKQYWSDFMMLMNSDFLVDRRNGMRINISENEIANAANTSGNKAQAAISYILSKGYAPTQFADSFAIALGGATYFRNRSADLMKNNPDMTQQEADAQSMLEFREKAEESQQSSDPMRISQQQSSDAGRLILAYANTPMQYARMQKRAFQDLAAGRGDNKSNVSKIIYYGVIQNLIFNTLQQAVFALAFNSEDDDEKEVEKAIDVANGMADSILRGLGMGGAAVAVAKNFLLDIYERSGRSRPEYVDSIYKLLQFSPPISSKISKLRTAAWQMDSKKRRKKAMEDFGLDNPGYEAGTKVISAVTNVPLDRLLLKMQNIDAAMDEETEWWQSVAMLAGWPEWQINPKEKSFSVNKKKKTQRKRKTTSRVFNN